MGWQRLSQAWTQLGFLLQLGPGLAPPNIPIVTAATTCLCIPHRLGVDAISLAGLFPRLQGRRVPTALKKLPWRGKPQAGPGPSEGSPAAGAGSPFGEVPYLASPRRFSSGMHLGTANMRWQLNHHSLTLLETSRTRRREGRQRGERVLPRAGGRTRTRDLRLSSAARRPAEPEHPTSHTSPPGPASTSVNIAAAE